MIHNRAYKEIGRYFQFLFDDHGYQIVGHSGGDSGFASLVEAKSDDLQVRFIIDREHPYIDVGLSDSDIWCSLVSVRQLIMGDWLIGKDSKVEKLASFLKNHYWEVVALFTEDAVARTVAQIEEAEREWRKSYFSR